MILISSGEHKPDKLLDTIIDFDTIYKLLNSELKVNYLNFKQELNNCKLKDNSVESICTAHIICGYKQNVLFTEFKMHRLIDSSDLNIKLKIYKILLYSKFDIPFSYLEDIFKKSCKKYDHSRLNILNLIECINPIYNDLKNMKKQYNLLHNENIKIWDLFIETYIRSIDSRVDKKLLWELDKNFNSTELSNLKNYAQVEKIIFKYISDENLFYKMHKNVEELIFIGDNIGEKIFQFNEVIVNIIDLLYLIPEFKDYKL